ncbi:MAG: pantetheine-phosphate adenylyltransferase [Gammaproteobacteria bacterium]|nr:pantetheine-phosphate adenylyltransferase [Gammaproteobacteria bacterium]MCD8542077.1 pantetheine-phosphate adenylyltransferase [Gammaproteobacteria bacterium]MCD8573869.1 pantetheine-phosphate adenylyltransferase [Gammaproteobacteria bacterium]
MKKIAVYPGTFDPLTNGHVNIVERALRIFDQVIVAVAENPDKRPFLTYQRRIELATQCFLAQKGVVVEGFSGLLTDFVVSKNTTIVIRGLRAVSDFEYEFMLAGMNRKLMPMIETVYLMPSDDYMFVSSSFVREVAKLKGDISALVPNAVLMALSE